MRQSMIQNPARRLAKARTRVQAIAWLLAAVLSLPLTTALAQGGYPNRPVRLVLGAPPGGAADAFARIVAPRLADLLGQPVVIDNRPGANNNISTELVAHAQPDGYTLLWGFSPALVINPSLYKNLPFDPQKDFAPILLLGSLQFILVTHRSIQAASVQELTALVKAKPRQFQYASAGIGSPQHLATELFKRKAGIDLIHVPYKGGGPAVIAVLGGETQVSFASLASVAQHIKAGSLKALAVSGPKRSPQAPAVPTMDEAGFPGFDVRAWHGVLAPAGTPRPIVRRLHQDLLKVVSAPEVKAALAREGLEQDVGTPEDFAAYIKAETALWAKVIKDANITAE
jgi:tripartite-type tricarboxylate transporter receptor subunit TctC